MDKILTISIAAYNMEKYIQQTLDSLIDKRVIDDLEIFVIDDGGTDKTLEIAKECAKDYPNSIIPVHKENGGYGTTVNYSIAHATGKYFHVLDGDDWFDTDGLVKLVFQLKKADVDLIVSPYCSGRDKDTAKIAPFTLARKQGILRTKELKDSLAMWNFTYRTGLLRKSKVELPSGMLYTDVILAMEPIAIAATVQITEYPIYCHRVERDGQSMGKQSFVEHYDQLVIMAKRLGHFYESQKEISENRDYLLARAVVSYLWAVKAILWHPINEETRKKLIAYEKEMKDVAPTVYHKVLGRKKMGKFIWLMRKTNYAAYWILKCIPGGYPFRLY